MATVPGQPAPVNQPRIPENNPQVPTIEELLPSHFIPVDSVGNYKAGNRRNGAGGVIYPSGRIEVNVAGSEGLLRLAGDELQRPNLGIYWAANPAAQEIAGRFLTSDKARVVPFRYNPKSRTFTLYLHDVFIKNPTLRPVGRQDVAIAFRPGNGYEYVVIQMALALPKVKGNAATATEAGQGQQQAQAQPAPAAQNQQATEAMNQQAAALLPPESEEETEA